MNRLFRSTATRLQQKGSALLASLMVIVGLSLLGLAFVAISETESAISINERNHSQSVAMAEAAARVCVQWFQSPTQMRALNLMPVNDNAIKTSRTVGAYSGFYKATVASELFCDLPYGPLDNDKLYGAEDSADIIIDRNTAQGSTFLDTFNNNVFGAEPANAPRPAGEITEIRIYAPPIQGAVLVPAAPPHFYIGGTRYGVATIMARAEKFDRVSTLANRRSLARAECRIVVSQFPLPTPGGPLQSQTALGTNGNFNVHWGMVSSQASLDLKKDYTTLPWFNAYEKIHYNRGYDSSVQWSPGAVYRTGDIVRPTPAYVAANPAVRGHEYVVTSVPASGATVHPTTSTEPSPWPVAAGGTYLSSGAAQISTGTSLTYTERGTTAYPLSFGGAAGQSNIPWLYYIGRGTINLEDPWFHARAVQNDVSAGNGNAQPTPFPYANPGTYGATHHFQFQAFDQYPNFKQLIFPIINYDFWKAAAIAGNGQSGVKYLQWVAADTYTDGVTTKTMRAWAGSTPGYYFFDTQNAQNPQNGGPGVLAPSIAINGASTYMSSFIYLNAGFQTTGLSGPAGQFGQPGEPYMDIGYRQVDITTGDFVRDAAGIPVVQGAVNSQWDFQDLPWSNSGASNGGGPGKNGQFDVYVALRTVHDPSDTGNPTSTYAGWFPVPYTPGCKPGNNSCGTCNCSEPHEPYLNIKYDGTSLTGLTIGWQDPGILVTTRRKPKRTIDPISGVAPGGRTDTMVTCTAASSQADCTSNAYDLDGALVPLSPATDGVLYVEGDFSSKGNADYYGSVLVGKTVDSQGTPNLWFDESLSRGIRLKGFPRVMVTSVETDR